MPSCAIMWQCAASDHEYRNGDSLRHGSCSPGVGARRLRWRASRPWSTPSGAVPLRRSSRPRCASVRQSLHPPSARRHSWAHHVETVEAMLHFPEARGLFVCHDASVWHDRPPELSRLLRYVAVDKCVQDRPGRYPFVRRRCIVFIQNGGYGQVCAAEAVAEASGACAGLQQLSERGKRSFHHQARV
jgi:hypothetical protein